MATKVEVSTPRSSSTDVFEAEGAVDAISHSVNMTIKRKEKFVSIPVPGGGKRSVIAESVLAIWDE